MDRRICFSYFLSRLWLPNISFCSDKLSDFVLFSVFFLEEFVVYELAWKFHMVVDEMVVMAGVGVAEVVVTMMVVADVRGIFEWFSVVIASVCR